MKDAWLIVLCMFFALCITGVGAGIFFGFIKPQMDAKNVLKNGVETAANIIRLNSSVTKDSKQYYYFELSFHNAKGEEIRVKTNSLYPEQFISEQEIASKNSITHKYDTVEKETVQVMYKGNKAVLKGFVPKEGDGWLWLFPVFFGIAGIGFFMALLFALMNVIAARNISQ